MTRAVPIERSSVASTTADEAWDLVMEFVASETEHEAETDTCLSCFETGEALPAAGPWTPNL